ncbi:Endoribonuclease L-PSP [Rhizobium tibeticum]|uniref:Endoribonuclease L-PSP n=1 Tax=Rhizobium tibeticum TaxID=501024 RepID=A0A1H8WYB0_9HYPH|nr:RutC family protein [Rhizobium tibeticum]SEP32596.1 Endoribonuclease L-PSP [Rhizobium tibeticum]
MANQAVIEEVSTTDAPGGVGPYSQAVKVGGLLFVFGQLPIDPATSEFNSANAVEQYPYAEGRGIGSRAGALADVCEAVAQAMY